MSARVLLAEDDAFVRRAIGNALVRAGFAVTTAEDGAAAVALSSMHRFDIVIADLNMPTLGGVDVVKHYKNRFGRAICCIVLTGEDDEQTCATCLGAGADDVIAKPTTPSHLRQRLSAAVHALQARAA